MTEKRKYYGTKKRKELTDFEMDTLEKYKARFSKWQNKQIDLLTFCVSLLFTLSVAVSGFILSNQDKEIFENKVFSKNYDLTKTALFVLALSSTIGIIGLIARLNDFRLTKNVINFRKRLFELDNDIKYENVEASKEEWLKSKLDNSICWAAFLGRATWVLFYVQLILFISTIWMIILNV